MRSMILALLLFCGSASAAFPALAPTAPVRGATIATFGEDVRVGDVTVRPIRVVEDSRCPRDVLCAWAGRFRLLARVGREEMVLTLHQPQELAQGGTIVLAWAAPDRWNSPPPDIDPTPRFGFLRTR